MKTLKSFVIAITLMLLVNQTLHAQEIFDAIRKGDFTKVKELVEKDPKLINIRTPRRSTPLHVAVDINNEQIVKYLLEKKADPNAKGNNDFTPLYYAKNITITKLLVENGADVNENMPIAWVLMNGRKDVADYLIDKGAKLPEAKTPQGLLFLVRSLRCGSSKLFKIYLQQGFDLRYESMTKNNLLHYASESNSTELVNQLMENGLQANRRNIFGWTPLHITAANGNLEVVKSLLTKGVDINERTNDGKTPFNLAVDSKNDETAEYLKIKGVDQSPQKFPDLEGEYMGQPKPGNKAVLFAPGVLDPKLEYHGAIVFSPNGNEMYWSAYVDDQGPSILRSQRLNGKWGKPEVFIRGDVPFISPDGNKFYYVAFKQVQGGNKEVIYVREKTTSGWSEAKEMPETINSVAQVHWQVSVDKTGNLYYGASQESGSRIYYSALVEGKYTPPQVINSFKDIEAFSPYIAPDGSYLIFSTVSEGENVSISFKKRDGTWTKGIDLSTYLGIKGAFCPIVTHDGKYLFFVCSVDGQYAHFWVEASFIEELRPKELNGQSAVIEQEKQENTDNIVYTILYNNISVTDSIIADHGFACLVESGDHYCLFDAGRNSNKFMKNVNKLGVNYSRINQVFVSHIHGDHMGGLFDILAKCNKPALYLPYSYPQAPGEPHTDKSDSDFSEMLHQLKPLVSEIIREKESVKVGDKFFTTGMIEDQTYEQALIVPTSKGLVIITGCAHPGILEIVKRAKELMKQDVYFVMGGFHLVPVDSTRVKTIAQELRKLTKYIGPCHCTGEKAQAIFKDIFKEDYINIQAGLKLKLGNGKIK